MKRHHIHSLNSSSAKQKYSFGKGQRFSPYKPKTDVSYLPPEKQDKRSAIIGYGERSLVVDKYQAKYPHAYSLPSSITGSKGNSLKAGRYDNAGPFQHLKFTKQLPGPQYQIPSTLDARGPTIKSRKEDKSIAYKQYIPGPGAYGLPSSIDNGEKKVFESKFHSGGSMRLAPKQYKSLDIRTPTYEKKNVPGPGQYDTLKYGISNPQNVLSSIPKTKMGKQKRSEMANMQSAKVPGPGQYKLYSQFDD